MASQLYFLSLYVNMAQGPRPRLATVMGDLNGVLSNPYDNTTCLYKYKVTGEPRIISVFNVSDVIGFEKLLAEIHRYASVDVNTVPIIWYQHLAEFLGVDESLRPLGQDTLKGFKQLFWLDFSCEYPGKSTQMLLDTMKREATAALTYRNTEGHLELFKVVGERKVHVFTGVEAVSLDRMSFTLPMMQENGNGITIVTQRLLNLDDYVSGMLNEEQTQITVTEQQED